MDFDSKAQSGEKRDDRESMSEPSSQERRADIPVSLPDDETLPLRRPHIVDLREQYRDHFVLLTAAQNAADILSGKGSVDDHFILGRSADQWLRMHRRPMITINGSARNEALTEESREFTRFLAKELIPIGVCLANGGAETGVMGISSDAWTDAERAYRAERDGSPSGAEVFTVLLKLHGPKADYELPKELEFGMSSEKQRSWLTRTPFLHGVGDCRVILNEIGGLGTFFEVFYPLTCRQMEGKGPSVMYHPGRPASEFIFTSFWKPTLALINEMRECGACKIDNYHTTVILPHELSDGAKYIARIFEDSKSIVGINPRPRSPEYREYGAAAFERLMASGFEPRNSAGAVTNVFHSLLDNYGAAQRLVYHFRETMNLFEKSGRESADACLEAACRNGPAERGEVLGAIRRLADRPAIYLVGSAKEIWNEQMEQYSRTIIDAAVRDGTTVVIDGKGTEGMPRRWSQLWAERMSAFEQATGRRSMSELVRVQLAYTGEEIPARTFGDNYRETVLPAFLTPETKTAVAASIGCQSKRAFVLFPDGHPGLLALSHIALDAQLAGSVDGIYASKAETPEIQIINVPGKPGRPPFFDNLALQLREMEAAKTISPGDSKQEWFEPLTDPRQAALDFYARIVK